MLLPQLDTAKLPEIEYTGKNEFLKGAAPVISLDFAGQWNGVSMERRTEVKDFQHKEPVEGSAIIEIFNEKNKCVYKADNVSVIDGKLEHTVSDTGRMTTGTGGLGPYTCIWYEIGFDESKLDYDWIPVHTGPSYEVGPWFSHEIRLEVTDATGNTVTISVWVEVIDRIN